MNEELILRERPLSTALTSSSSSMAAVQARAEKRRSVVNELLETESNYVEDLRICIELFLHPLREAHLLEEAQVKSLFVNVESLLPVNARLLDVPPCIHSSTFSLLHSPPLALSLDLSVSVIS